MSRPLRVWHRPAVYRSAIGLYIFVVLAVAGATFAVNNIDVQGSVYLRAQPDLERDRNHGMRGVMHYAPTGEMLVPEDMQWFLKPADGSPGDQFPVEFTDGAPHESWPNPTFRVGDDVPDGDYQLHVETSHRQVSELNADYPVSITDREQPAGTVQELRWPRQTARENDARQRDPTIRHLDDGSNGEDKDQSPGVALAVAPDDGEMVRGMPQTLYFRTYHPESGLPIPSTLTLEITDGLLEDDVETEIRTNRLGIAEFDVKPATSLTIEMTVEPAPPRVFDPDFDDDDPTDPIEKERFELTLPSVATQYSLSPTSPVVTPEEIIEAAAFSVLSDGYFMVDLYDHEGVRLLDTLSLLMTDGRSGVQFQAPSAGESSRLLRMQAYQSIYGTTHGWDNAYILLLDGDSDDDLRDAVGDLFAWIASSTSSLHHEAIVDGEYLDDLSTGQLHRLLNAGLAEVPRTFELPPVMLNTREDDRRELDAWRADVQGDLRWMMGLVLIIGLIVVIYFVVAGIRRNMEETAVLRQFDLESTDPADETQRRAERIERLATALQGIIVFCTLLVFALGILIMVSYL